MPGPHLETPAEVRMPAGMGADVVGMSMVPEAIAARHLGGRVFGLAVVTNRAAGTSAEPVRVDELVDAGGGGPPGRGGGGLGGRSRGGGGARVRGRGPRPRLARPSPLRGRTGVRRAAT